MSYVDGQPVLWPAPPDWDSGVDETLAWLTDTLQSTASALQQVRALRMSPRRSLAFQTVSAATSRRIADAIAFDMGTRQFLLPIYPDVQWLAQSFDAGAEIIECNTAGYDFAAGGQIVLWQDEQTWELATIDAIAADGLTLTVGTANAWPVGTRLYPVRKARLRSMPVATQAGSDTARLKVTFLLDEPCGWPAAWPGAATYRDVPVLEWRGDESDNPTVQYTRQGSSVDQDTGTIYYFDLPGLPFRVQSQSFVLGGRASHTAFRSLLYALAGQCGQVWVPSWQDDLSLLAAIAAADTTISVAPCYYSVFGAQQINRRDIRIELYDGTVYYRRITGSGQLAGSETLQIDSALGRAIAPGDVRQINWLTLSQLSSDSVKISHITDANGVATCKLSWQGVQNSV